MRQHGKQPQYGDERQPGEGQPAPDFADLRAREKQFTAPNTIYECGYFPLPTRAAGTFTFTIIRSRGGNVLGITFRQRYDLAPRKRIPC